MDVIPMALARQIEILNAEVSNSTNGELFCHRRQPAVVVNAVLRHGPSDPRDDQTRPIPATLAPAWAALMTT
jgi:hypothetical protein